MESSMFLMFSYSTDFSMFGLNTSGSDFNQKSGQISNIEEVDFLNLFLVNDEVNDVEKSKGNNIEIDILNDTKDKAPDPAVIETAEDEHKEVSKWTGRVHILIYLKLNKDFRLLK